ncbi:single-stranded-DNA-specific exonuclease RecJ [Pelagibaculum spongiae]|uniref:Single-stranded-DNA-specific exonuclease RecJ n=1 Tax=Pelagibaculum spongiae TaxID=2080658 RepID=A0A2V1GSH4_9GAMM|nr:single-stranded-DNA-specific exonuclease RecJ [Pelagibaculum spongiae]PVZ64998.1 single-stranded-DNA-specific exonuclease RecJ [Pelagibaculum spongiae]
MSFEISQRSCPAGHLDDQLPMFLQRIYLSRGILHPDQLDMQMSALEPPHSLKEIEPAIALLRRAIRSHQRILIVGDYDADGACSTAVALLGLKAMGAVNVDYLVPNRFETGYGLCPEIVEQGIAKFAPDLIITVDNGISSIEGAKAAKAAGVALLITDHHLAGEQLPEADAIVNPNQPECRFPDKALCGCGVMFYILLALRTELRRRGWFNDQLPEPNMGHLLDLVALATVADVVPLSHNNRILVQQGLARIRAGRSRPGITALLELANRNPQRLVASDLGFAVAPRLNAAGRLEDMSLGIRCLLTDSVAEARQLAQQLDQLNDERRHLEQEMQQQARLWLEELDQLKQKKIPRAICLYRSDWHQGVIGILASRIKDIYHRPVIAFADGGDGMIRGSARSVAKVHIRDAIESVTTKHPHLLKSFGGHAMAAGLSLKAEHLPAFELAFIEEVENRLAEKDCLGVYETDGPLAGVEMTLDTAKMLRNGGPWGQGFAEPSFHGLFWVDSWRVVGEKHWKLTLISIDGGEAIDAIWFSPDAKWTPQQGNRLELVYRLDVNEFRQREAVQIMVVKGRLG